MTDSVSPGVTQSLSVVNWIAVDCMLMVYMLSYIIILVKGVS